MIADESIEKVKDTIQIKEVIADFVKLKKEGVNWVGLCPFHAEKSPSFKVHPVKNMYKCFGCGRSGNAIGFIMEHEKLGYISAIQYLAKKFGIELEAYEKKEYTKPPPRLTKIGPKALQWFEEERKISNNTLLRFNITEATEYMDPPKAEVTAICFNYYKGGELINIKFRGPKKSFKLSSGAEPILYNIDAIKDEKTAIIVEGEIDCLTLHECGIYNVVSVPNGTPPKGKLKMEYMDTCWEYFLNKEEVIIATDADEPGKFLRQELARRIGYEKCRQVVFPEDCKDPNEILLKYGKERVVEVFNNSTEWPVEGLYTPDQWGPEVDEYYENGYPPGAKTKIPGFDELLTFFPGQLTVVTGTPGSGKSEFVDYIMTSLALYENWTWGICSFETKVPKHVTKLAEKITRKAFDFRRNPNHRMTPRELEYAKNKVRQHFHFVNLSLIDVTMDGLIQKGSELVRRKGIDGLLFDPWNCIEHKYGDESETKYTLTCLNKFLAFLDRNNVHGVLVAHPTKLKKDPRTGKYPIPTLYDISGSAHFFNRTHNGMSVVRDYHTNQVDIYVQKVKDSWLGKLGYCSFNYDTLTRQYEILPGLNEEPDKNDLQSGWKPVENGDLFDKQ